MIVVNVMCGSCCVESPCYLFILTPSFTSQQNDHDNERYMESHNEVATHPIVPRTIDHPSIDRILKDRKYDERKFNAVEYQNTYETCREQEYGRFNKTMPSTHEVDGQY